jgi:hypothetical protein
MTLPSQQHDANRSGHATWRPFAGEVLDIVGGAFEPEIKDYRDNTGEIGDRSLQSLLVWTAPKGVVVPEYMRIIPYPPDVPLMHKGKPVPAKYFNYRPRSEVDRIYWNNAHDRLASIVDPDFNAVVVNIDSRVLDRDEEFLHVIAHEVYEISQLKKYIESGDTGLSAIEVYNLIEPLATLKNLHWEAWDYADSIVTRLRENS